MAAVILKDGSRREYPRPVTPLQVAEDISKGLAKDVLVAKVNGELWDLNREMPQEAELELLTFDCPEARDVYRHSSAHLMAQAVKELYPDAKLAIGPAIEDGFYYDFDLKEPLTQADLEKIERRMQELAKEDHVFQRQVLSREEALKFFRERGEDYKVELIENLPEDAEISYYRQGDFVDLCAGPHVGSTGRIRAFKLTSVAGAYWRGDENNVMLQRVYGTSFVKQSQLEEHLKLLEEAKKRDHRKLGRELDLFSISEDGPGMPFYHPKGVIIWNELLKLWREEHAKDGYMEIRTPQILNKRLWEQSGHWDNYAENMYFTEVDDNPFALKPMNCPGAMLWYLTSHRSYRDLPLRTAELGLVHRHERSGALHGLMRVRAFTQDDAHIFMLPSQIEEEISGVIDLVDRLYKVFGLDYRLEISTRPEKSMGAEEQWEMHQCPDSGPGKQRRRIQDQSGDGAFTGPRSTSTSWTASSAAGSAPPSSWTSRCPSALTSPIRERTARSTALSWCTGWPTAPSTASWASSSSTSPAPSRFGCLRYRLRSCPSPTGTTTLPGSWPRGWRPRASGWKLTCAMRRLAIRFAPARLRKCPICW